MVFFRRANQKYAVLRVRAKTKLRACETQGSKGEQNVAVYCVKNYSLELLNYSVRSSGIIRILCRNARPRGSDDRDLFGNRDLVSRELSGDLIGGCA